jgi:hypothetical protein
VNDLAGKRALVTGGTSGIGRATAEALASQCPACGPVDAADTGRYCARHLAIARAHGGAIDVASAPGRGSTFSLRLPARPQAETTSGSQLGHRQARRKPEEEPTEDEQDRVGEPEAAGEHRQRHHRHQQDQDELQRVHGSRTIARHRAGRPRRRSVGGAAPGRWG